MKKEKFIYNTQTLQYEKVEATLQSKLLRAFGLLCAVLVFSGIISLFALNFLPSPKEKILLRELNQMKHQYEVVNEQMDLQAKVLENLQERDANVHRMIFGMSPIDEGVWEGGVGGSEKYEHLSGYRNAGKVMAQTMKRLDKLGRQMAIQSKSLDSIVVLIKEKDKMLGSLPSIRPIHEDKLNRALSQMSGFGMRVHPIYKVRKMHYGIDFAARSGTPIYAAGDGVVSKKQSARSGYGNNIVINHGYGYETLYAHMSKVLVSPGQKIKKGQTIGLVGSTGTSTAPHLHYEVHYKGTPVNPIDYCQDALKPQEYAQLVDMAHASNLSFD
jgi:septal ring factor EnvC (AmiA/AmiB activator)